MIKTYYLLIFVQHFTTYMLLRVEIRDYLRLPSLYYENPIEWCAAWKIPTSTLSKAMSVTRNQPS